MYFIPYDSRLTTYGQWKMAAYWLEEYVWSPHGKGSRHIQRLGGGDIPRLTSGQAVQELMVFSAGASFGWKKELQSSLRGKAGSE